MPDAIITSTASTFGTITGTFAADQSTITGTVTGIITGTLDGSVGVPGVGVPDGGTTGQVLQKATNTSYDTVWATPSGGAWGTITGTLSNQTDLQTALNLKAPLASPGLTGVPTAPTAATLTSTTQLATTAFVQQELLSGTANAKNLEVYVRNQTGSTIPAGSIVYINGATGNRPTITLAQANNDANSAQTFGFVKTSIANNGFGFVIVRGELENIDTSALTEGVQLYLSPTTAGTWTTTKPSAPQHLVYVGICVRAHPTQGVILVAVQNGYELNELHDVQITSPTNGQVLKYNSSTSLWYNGLDVGIPVGGTAGQFLTKIDGTDYNTDWTTVNLSVYAVKSNNLSDLTSASTARTNLGLGTMAMATASDYSTTTVANGLYYPLSTNPAGYLTSASLTGYATESWVTAGFYPLTGNPSGFITSSALTPYLTSATAASTYYLQTNPAGYLPASTASFTYAALTGATFTGSVNLSSLGVTFFDATTQTTAGLSPATAASTYQTIAGMSSYAPLASPALTGNVTITTNSTSPALFIEQSGTGNILTLHDQASDTTFVAIDQNGKVNTIPSVAASAGFNIAHGAAPTTPVNGDIWTTTGGLFMRQNGSTKQYVDFDGTQTINGSKTFSNASNTFGNSTATGTTSIASGATISGSTKAVNIGTAGVSGSTTNITVGPVLGASTTSIGNTTAASTLNLATGATLTATTKAVNIGTNGVAGSTTNITIGSTTGTSTTTLQGITNGVTQSAGDSSLKLATTAFVTTADNLKANLASPSFTGVPLAPTATLGTNTTQIATTAFVTAALPALATTSDSRQFTNDTKAMSPRDVLWSMLSQDLVYIDGPSMTTTNTGTITYVNIGQLSRVIRPGNAGACSSRIRTFGFSQVDQTWTASSRAQPSSFLNFSLRSIHSGRSTTSGVTDANYTCAVYYGKAEADGVGNLTRRGYGWKMVGGAGSRFIELQAHNGTTLSSVTSSFAVTAGVAFDWDIESDGAGNVTLYVNGSSVATSTGGPTGSVNITGVAWQEEVAAAAALSSPYMDFVNSRGRYIVINTW